MEKNKIEFGWIDEEVIIRIVGKGSFLNSRHFKVAATDLLEKAYDNIIVDLADCHGMDSTFIGVLTGVTLKMMKANKHNIVLVNMCKVNRETLEILGVIRFFDVEEEPRSFEADFESVEDIPEDPDEAIHQIKHILEAHETLIKVDDKNSQRFKLVKESLEKDLSHRLNNKKNNE